MFMYVFQQCFDEAEKNFDEMTAREKKMGRDDWAHGSLLIINELLRCSNIEGEVCMWKKWTTVVDHALGLYLRDFISYFNANHLKKEKKR